MANLKMLEKNDVKFFEDKRKYILIDNFDERSNFFGEINIYVTNIILENAIQKHFSNGSTPWELMRKI